jgi:hypothetical protein
LKDQAMESSDSVYRSCNSQTKSDGVTKVLPV